MRRRASDSSCVLRGAVKALAALSLTISLAALVHVWGQITAPPAGVPLPNQSRPRVSPSPSTPSPPPPKPTSNTEYSPDTLIHTVATVGCGGKTSNRRGGGPSQTRWQAYQALALEHSWSAVKQPGHFTRLVSGCREEWEFELMAMTGAIGEVAAVGYDPEVKNISLPDGYHAARVHSFFVKNLGGSYSQGNKPFMLRRWLRVVGEMVNTYILMVDPDMIFTAPVLPYAMGCKPGVPAAQVYQIELRWREWLDELCGEACKYFPRRDDAHAVYKFHAGPPYVFHSSDFSTLLAEWEPLIPPVHRKYGRIESDMLAYVIAAVKLRLPHVLLEKSPWVPGPGNGALSGGCQGLEYKYPGRPEPPILHYCSNYKVDAPYWFINKHWFRPTANTPFSNVIDCEMPLLVEPLPPEKPSKQQDDVYRSGQVMVQAINAMLEYVKPRYCPTGSRVVLKKGLLFKEASDYYSFTAGSSPYEEEEEWVHIYSVHQQESGHHQLARGEKARDGLLDKGWMRLCLNVYEGTTCNRHATAVTFRVHRTTGEVLVQCRNNEGVSLVSTGGCPSDLPLNTTLGYLASAPTDKMTRPLYSCGKVPSGPLHAVGMPCAGTGPVLGYVG